MKKVAITLALCLVVGFSFAQKKAVSEAKEEIKTKNATQQAQDLGEARRLIQGALQDPETKDDAETWYVAGQIEEKAFSTEQTKEVMGLKPVEDVMYSSLTQIGQYFIKADSLGELPNDKGKVKNRFRKDMKAILLADRSYYINAGIYFFERENYERAYTAFKFYGDIPALPMMAGEKFPPAMDDTIEVQIRYYAGLAASYIPDPSAATEIFNSIKDLKYNENEIYQRLATLYQQQEDTVNFTKTLEEGAAKFPGEAYYMLNLINLKIINGQTTEAVDYLNKAIAISPDNAQLYDVVGQVYEEMKNFDKASESFQKAIEIQPDYSEAYSHAGRLYYNAGVEQRGKADNIADKTAYEQEAKKAQDYFNEALRYYEKAYELNADDKDAVFALRNIYYTLGINDKYEKMDKIYSGQ
ncbi:hypothetical protein AGMMS50262_13700 [Bacteroidia bacterium]|nr:hypothetical protein AGMMS50262_13700 [Bacteroidia bacterium]